MRYLGIDYGTKDVGIALTDEGGSMAFPKAVLPNTSELLPKLKQMIQDENVNAIVIGYSLNNEGKENPVMKNVAHFCELLTRETGLQIYFEPEQFSSKQAARTPGSLAKTDASAAAIILNTFLMRMNPKSVLDDLENE